MTRPAAKPSAGQERAVERARELAEAAATVQRLAAYLGVSTQHPGQFFHAAYSAAIDRLRDLLASLDEAYAGQADPGGDPPHAYIPTGPVEAAPYLGYCPPEVRQEAFSAVLEGVELGAYHRRIITWLAQWDDWWTDTAARHSARGERRLRAPLRQTYLRGVRPQRLLGTTAGREVQRSGSSPLTRDQPARKLGLALCSRFSPRGSQTDRTAPVSGIDSATSCGGLGHDSICGGVAPWLWVGNQLTPTTDLAGMCQVTATGTGIGAATIAWPPSRLPEAYGAPLRAAYRIGPSRRGPQYAAGWARNCGWRPVSACRPVATSHSATIAATSVASIASLASTNARMPAASITMPRAVASAM